LIKLLIFYKGSNVDLGTACGKYFHVGALAVTDPGNKLKVLISKLFIIFY
jgi:ribosomal protein L30E